MQALRIIADAHIWGVREAFTRLPGFEVDLHPLEAKAITRSALKHADILITRSSTRVDAELLSDTSVRFAATATIGDDHYDKAWLDATGIGWANAAGSSTGSVVEYMLSTLLWLQAKGRISFSDTKMGIIGVGRIGSQLAEICQGLGMQVLLNDPPRARIEGGNAFESIDTLTKECDLITLHTPLIREGRDCTRHLLDTNWLAGFAGKGIINAARGDCVDNRAMADWLDADSERFAVFDCWEQEPKPDARLFAHTGMLLSTPHIAGHSLDGKAANTLFAYRALCRFLNIDPDWEITSALPPDPEPQTIEAHGNAWQQVQQAVSSLYDITADHRAMQAWSRLGGDELAAAFTGYRRHYPVRRAWQHMPIRFQDADAATLQLAHAMGLRII